MPRMGGAERSARREKARAMTLRRKPSIHADVTFEHRVSLRQAYFTLSGHLWKPATDIAETEAAFLIRVEVAGVPEEAIAITVDGNRLIVRGARTEERRAEVVRYHTLELQYGKFELVFQFPFSLGMKDVKAGYRQGLLSIEVPKKGPATEPISIQIVDLT